MFKRIILLLFSHFWAIEAWNVDLVHKLILQNPLKTSVSLLYCNEIADGNFMKFL